MNKVNSSKLLVIGMLFFAISFAHGMNVDAQVINIRNKARVLLLKKQLMENQFNDMSKKNTDIYTLNQKIEEYNNVEQEFFECEKEYTKIQGKNCDQTGMVKSGDVFVDVTFDNSSSYSPCFE